MIEQLERSENGKPDKLVYSIPDTAHVLGDVSPNHVRNLIRDKQLDEVMIGRRKMVTAASVRRLVENGGTRASESSVAA